MAPWPELLQKQQEEHAREGFDWRTIARDQVFPHLEDRLPRMRALHREFLRDLPGAWRRTQRVLGVRFPVRFVIYVGTGLGSWATSYGGQPACLIGLENAAEKHDGTDGWARRIVAHEVGHLTHEAWRKERLTGHTDPYWMLYEKGFATYAERRVEPRAFPGRTGREDWLPWCDEHRAWLAQKFLADVQARRSLRPFFGSWFNVRGRIETGYYLGSEVIRRWTRTQSLAEIARIPESEIRERVRTALRGFAEGGRPRH